MKTFWWNIEWLGKINRFLTASIKEAQPLIADGPSAISVLDQPFFHPLLAQAEPLHVVGYPDFAVRSNAALRRIGLLLSWRYLVGVTVCPDADSDSD
ncbi:MAG: hypothetical protein IPL59_22860 [Candidatus Competibacteraceae bacterium]|nr:hypothetical protein [Candidatus Competibacteraceae bacterium]